MMFKIRYKLWKEKRAMSPDFIFKRDLKNRLAVVFEEKYPQLPKENIFNFSGRWRVATVAMSVVAVGFFGTSAYAYNATSVVEGNPLYPIKLAVEKVEEVIKITPAARAKFYIKVIERREAEKEKIVKTENKEEEKTVEIKTEKTILPTKNKEEKEKKIVVPTEFQKEKEIKKAEVKEIKEEDNLKDRQEKTENKIKEAREKLNKELPRLKEDDKKERSIKIKAEKVKERLKELNYNKKINKY